MEGIRFSSSKKEEDPATINAVDNHTNIVSARSSTGQNIPAFSTDQATCSSVSPRHDGDCEAGTHGGLLRKDCGRERLRKHIEEVAGRVMIPDTWGQENLLKDWIDCSTFDELLAPNGISSARESLVAERRRGSSPGLRIASGNWQEKVSYCRSPKDANS
ncbi:hypothetical protein OIU77_029334 [Salix suchowensis]|uniref:Protein BIC1-like n=1 Tax=Salix suchowensis TaxID=1278906 RepID=A0ABQ9BML4_9ROSI|nr:hypothetical protein OIU78_008991 [Salix suchowensis]KAJ6386341.1 hypothetical protein OIU77_029334 [Salix suchowensis]